MKEALKPTIEQIVARIKRGDYIDERAVEQGIVQPILRDLGWDIFNPKIVRQQFTIPSGGRVDFALCRDDGSPLVFIEAKRIGGIEGAAHQLFNYAFHHGVPMLILTDGKDWKFYLCVGTGGPNEREFYTLALMKRDPTECAEVFEKCLARTSVYSGESLEWAQKQIQGKEKERKIQRAIPKAWREILTQPNELVRDVLVEKVADMCGHKPGLEQAENFLRDIAGNFPPNGEQDRGPIIWDPPPPDTIDSKDGKRGDGKLVGFVFEGKPYRFRHVNSVLEGVLNLFQERDAGFLARFKIRTDTDRRRLVDPRREALYPYSPHLTESSRQLVNGWWFATVISQIDAIEKIKIACEVAGVGFETDLKLVRE